MFPKVISGIAIVIMFSLLSGCAEVEPTPVAVVAEDTAVPNTPTPEPSNTPTLTAAPTETPVPTDTPAPTITPTPMPSLSVLVIDEANDEPLAASSVQLVNNESDVDMEQTTDSDGIAHFEALEEDTTYTVTVKLEGYLDSITSLDMTSNTDEMTVSMTAGLLVEVVTDSGALRSGPGTVYETVGSVSEGEVLHAVGRNDDGDWLVILTEEGDEVWLSVSLVTEVDVMAVTAVPAPVPPVPSPTVVVAAPPPPVVIPAGNLLTNPSFETGPNGWSTEANIPLRLYSSPDNSQFVHSGTQAAVKILTDRGDALYQQVHGVIPGQTYRAGAWVKVWSSDGNNHTLSENPGAYAARLCIGTQNETKFITGSTVCTGFVQPYDTWQYLTIDAVAGGESITILLYSAAIGANLPLHNEAIWDDVSLTASSIAATPIPTSAPDTPPVRPGPIPFNGVSMRDSMNGARVALEQIGGLLDRIYNGSVESCADYRTHYDQLVGSATYHSIPDDWHGIYNEYVFAIDNAVDGNGGVYSLCEHGGGGLNAQAYGNARQSINVSLDRIIPAIDIANALLGG
jgi:uncharacterized protein YgiM (DUF1202 family)